METQNWLLKQASTQPDKVAVDDGRQRLTFAELKTKVAELAGKLKQFHSGTRVGLLTTNSLLGYELALAIIASGCTIVWLNYRLSLEELQRQVSDSQLSLCLVEDSLWQPQMTAPFKKTGELTDLTTAPAKLVPTFGPGQVASIMYTSGTTGQPKGVLQTFENHFYSAVSSALNLGLSADDEWLCVAPIFHISGFSIIMRGLIYGMTVRLVEKFDAAVIEGILVNEPVTIMSAVPFMLHQLLAQQAQSKQTYNPHFRCLLLGGGTTERESLLRCQMMGIPVVQCYGMTETCSQVVALRAKDALNKIGSVGQPLFTTQLKLSSQGEVFLKTPALTPGYLNLPTKLSEKKVNGWYKTGDIGHFDVDGYLYIDGRKDEMMISGGENIFPQEVEQVYQKYPGIKEIAIVGQEDLEWGEVPVAFVVADQQIADQDLIQYGYQHLAHYKVPRRYLYLSKLPRNASGKLQRYLLKRIL